MSICIDISNLSKVYSQHSNSPLTVLDNLNMQIEQGEFVCILGPSGCGKTTLLKLIGGFEKPTSGEILANGKPVIRPSIDRSMVFQTFEQLLPWRTVESNITWPLKVNKIGKSDSERKEIALHYLKMVGLEKFVKYYPHQISGGMKQRAAIARSLSQSPQVILMDEPFASLDAQTRTDLQKELFQIWKESNVTVIFITHNVQEAIILGSKIMVMTKSPSIVSIEIDNPVKGDRMPGSEGFAECWKLLHDGISGIK